MFECMLEHKQMLKLATHSLMQNKYFSMKTAYIHQFRIWCSTIQRQNMKGYQEMFKLMLFYGKTKYDEC